MKKKAYRTWKFLAVIMAAILFLFVFGIISAKNAPPDTQFMDMEP